MNKVTRRGLPFFLKMESLKTTTGATLGQISSLVIDKTNGRVALAVLSDVPNIGPETLAIPFGSMTRTGQETFEFNLGDIFDEVARYLSKSEFTHLPWVMDLAWLTKIYRHYGHPSLSRPYSKLNFT